MTLAESNLTVLGIGVSPVKNDGVLRFEHFCHLYGLSYQIVGDGKVWRGGDMSAGAGGGQKINELVEAIKNMDNRLIIVCDTFDLFPMAGLEEILTKYENLCEPGQVLFSAEFFCWPDKELVKCYPPVQTKYKYLNSGSFMGYRDDIYELIRDGQVQDNDDDQRYFTQKFLLQEKDKPKIVLDYNCELFQAVNGCQEDLVIHKNRIYNKYTRTYPVFIHGNGPSKLFLNHLENYLESQPYLIKYRNEMKALKLLDSPKIFVAAYINSEREMEMQQFLEKLCALDYDNKIVFVYDRYKSLTTQELCFQMGFEYVAKINTYEWTHFKQTDCQFYFLLEQRCMLTKIDILHELVTYTDNYHRIIVPMLSKPNSLFSNFWGALDKRGYYERSVDYVELVERQKWGLWNVPYVTGVILFSREIVLDWDLMRSNKFTDPDMRLCENLRKNTLFMYITNVNSYGYLVEQS
jgi:hypothetical protein